MMEETPVYRPDGIPFASFGTIVPDDVLKRSDEALDRVAELLTAIVRPQVAYSVNQWEMATAVIKQNQAMAREIAAVLGLEVDA